MEKMQRNKKEESGSMLKKRRRNKREKGAKIKRGRSERPSSSERESEVMNRETKKRAVK